jgi:hypothetical protein
MNFFCTSNLHILQADYFQGIYTDDIDLGELGNWNNFLKFEVYD